MSGEGHEDVPLGPDNTPYDSMGGDTRVRLLADTFYEVMDRNPRFEGIRSLHPDDLGTSRDKFYQFLSGWLGGPQLYIQQHGHPRLRMRHAPFPIGESERDQWLGCMAEAMDELGITGQLRTFLDARFAQVADFMRNRG